MREVAQ